MNVRTLHPYATPHLTSSPDIPYPRGCITRPLEMHPDLGNPQQLKRRRSIPDNTSILLPSVRYSVSRFLQRVHIFVVEYIMESVLPPQLSIRVVHYDAGICSNEGEGEGVEIGWGMFGCFGGVGADCDAYIQEEE